jgi:hypothetical protein
MLRRGIVASGVAAAMGLAVGSLAWACTPPVGFTWYSDGSSSKSGPSGTVITVFATGARAGRTYQLVAGNGDPGHEDMACMFNYVLINPNNRVSSSTGFIGNTTGAVNRPQGTWQICFREPSGASGTAPATFTVI